MSATAVPPYDNHLGVKFCWAFDRAPFVVPERDDLVQLLSEKTVKRSMSPSLNIDVVRTGVPLPTFWAFIKSADSLKQDPYNWWRLDQSAKHLLASWILSQPQPKSLLALHPILWEIFPTMIIGSEVEACVTSTDGQTYTLRADAQPVRGILFDWSVNVESGYGIILLAGSQLRIEFSIHDLRPTGVLRLLEFFTPTMPGDSHRAKLW